MPRVLGAEGHAKVRGVLGVEGHASVRGSSLKAQKKRWSLRAVGVGGRERTVEGEPQPLTGLLGLRLVPSSSKASSFLASLGCPPASFLRLASHTVWRGPWWVKPSLHRCLSLCSLLPTDGQRLPSGSLSGGGYFLAPNILLIKKK